MTDSRTVVRVIAAIVTLAVLGGVTWWAIGISGELRTLRAEMPSDKGFEIDELRSELEELTRRVDRIEAAVADAEVVATDAQDSVDELRDDVIALGLALPH